MHIIFAYPPSPLLYFFSKFWKDDPFSKSLFPIFKLPSFLNFPLLPPLDHLYILPSTPTCLYNIHTQKKKLPWLFPFFLCCFHPSSIAAKLSPLCVLNNKKKKLSYSLSHVHDLSNLFSFFFCCLPRLLKAPREQKRSTSQFDYQQHLRS
jgi:hypothetical protein